MVLEKDGRDYLDRYCEKCKSITKNKGGEKCSTKNEKKEGNSIGQILHGNCLLKHIIEGKMEVYM